MKLPRKERNALKTSFTNDGSVGFPCRSSFELLRSSLLASNLAASMDPSATDLLNQIYSDGYFQILPSFFQLIKHLSKTKMNYRIIFRTFGIDTDRVSRELNMFCDGMHPFSAPDTRLNGKDGSIDRRLFFPADNIKLRRGPDRNGLSFSYYSSEEVCHAIILCYI